jgi:tRNA nucleotidyltransferase/poly(A) polymerase
MRRAPIADVDFVLPSGALLHARKVADKLAGSFFPLDEERGAGRVIVPRDQQAIQVDFTDFRTPTLEGDLKARDFTINALAVEVRPLVEVGRAPIIDPTGGFADLRRRLIRLCGPDSLEADPLRALRSVRLARQLKCSIEPKTRAAVRHVAPRVTEVAWERIRDEILMLLILPDAAPALRDLDRLDLLSKIFPGIEAMKVTTQPKPHRFTVWEHSLRTVVALDVLCVDLSLLAPFSERLARHLQEKLDGGITRLQILKLAGFLHDVAKPLARAEIDGRIRFIGHDLRGAEMAREIAERFRLTAKASRVLVQLVRHHLRPMHLGQLESISRRARYRFARDLGEDAQDLLLLALADAAALKGDAPAAVWQAASGRLVASLLEGWHEDEAMRAIPPLLRGEDVMNEFGLHPGPEVGRLLEAAREAQALGLVSTRDEALDYLRRARHDPSFISED